MTAPLRATAIAVALMAAGSAHADTTEEKLLAQMQRLAQRVVFIKIKYADFSEASRQETLDPPVQSSDALYRHAVDLMEKRGLAQKVRLIGVGAAGLVFKDTGVQLELFDMEKQRDSRWEKVDRSISAISEKFGKNAIKRGSLTD